MANDHYMNRDDQAYVDILENEKEALRIKLAEALQKNAELEILIHAQTNRTPITALHSCL